MLHAIFFFFFHNPGPQRRWRKSVAPGLLKGSGGCLHGPGVCTGGSCVREKPIREVSCLLLWASSGEGNAEGFQGGQTPLCPCPSASNVCKVLTGFVANRQQVQRQDGMAIHRHCVWCPCAYTLPTLWCPPALPIDLWGSCPLGSPKLTYHLFAVQKVTQLWTDGPQPREPDAL